MRGGAHLEEHLGEGEARHEAVRALFHVEAAVECAEAGEDRHLLRRRRRRPRGVQRGDARGRRQRLELDAPDGGHLGGGEIQLASEHAPSVG